MTARRLGLASVAAYAAGCIVWGLGGGRFLVYTDLWQLLPLPALEAGLCGALLDLHAQPPFLNALLGVALVVGKVTGTGPATWLYGAQLLAGAAAVAMLADLAWGLLNRPWLRVVVLGLVIGNPYLYASVHFFFYTIWELLFLSACAAAFARYAPRPSAAGAAAVLAPAVALVYTRSLFHPVWFLVVALAVAVRARGIDPPSRKRVIVVAAVAAAAICAWPLKNLARFDVAGFSSWSGYNLARGLPVERPELLRLFERGEGDAPAVAPAFAGRPALDAVFKPDGSANWNHPAMIELAKLLGARARAAIVQSPGLLFLRAADYYANGYTVYEGRQVYSAGWAPEAAAFPRWSRAWEIATMLAFRPYDPRRTRITTGFALLLPLLVAGLAVSLRHGRADAGAVLLLFFALWVLGMALFVDGAEGNRMRFSTQPFWWLLAGWWLERALSPKGA